MQALATSPTARVLANPGVRPGRGNGALLVGMTSLLASMVLLLALLPSLAGTATSAQVAAPEPLPAPAPAIQAGG